MESENNQNHHNHNVNHNMQIMEDGLLQLLSVLEPTEALTSISSLHHSALIEACRVIAQHLGAPFKEIEFSFKENASPSAMLETIINEQRLRIRPVSLTSGWFHNDCGPLLCFQKNEGRPIAMIPIKGKYHWVDDVTQTSQLVTDKFASSLTSTAYQFYKTFPDVTLYWYSIFKFVFGNFKKEFINVIVLQAVVGLLALFFPILTGIIFDHIVPNADIHDLKQMVLILTIVTLASTLFGLAQAIFLMRIRLKSVMNLQAAVWDRLLRLPIKFFRQFNAGDLALRALGIDTIQNQVTESSLVIMLGGVFSIFSLALMFYYDVFLAIGATMMAMVAIIITLIFDFFQIKYQREILFLQGKISDTLFQFLSSITKLRITNTIQRAFGLWSQKFAYKNKTVLKSQMNILGFETFFPFLIVISTALLYLMVILRGKNLSFGEFIAFLAAYTQFFAALLAMTKMITRSLEIVPLYERVQPILTTLPEIENSGISLITLEQKIEIQNLSFRYQPDFPFVFEDFSLTINKGDYLGVVGKTGSGKSTLFRLLLRFEHPNKGSILYDGHDLALLNINQLRAHCGVVLQNSTLLPGTIYENITGLDPSFTLDDAWNAAELMHIADEIRSFPMGMHTFISENGKNISSGQKQRIMLARAIVRKPSLLLLDEATTALDNITQQKVHENLSKLNVTRIVAAHRLETLKDANHIITI